MGMKNRVNHCPYVGNHTIYEEDIIDTATCTIDQCEFCGWNPAVARNRKEKLRNFGANNYKSLKLTIEYPEPKDVVFTVRYMKVKKESPYKKIS